MLIYKEFSKPEKRIIKKNLFHYSHRIKNFEDLEKIQKLCLAMHNENMGCAIYIVAHDGEKTKFQRKVRNLSATIAYNILSTFAKCYVSPSHYLCDKKGPSLESQFLERIFLELKTETDVFNHVLLPLKWVVK